MKRIALLLCVAGLAWTGWAASARAESVEDILTLAKNGLGEEVLLATVERNDAGYNLTPERIMKLKEAGVSEKVIAAMLRKRPTAPVAIAPAAMPPAPTPGLSVAPAPAVTGTGTLSLENVDDKTWAYQVDTAGRKVYVAPMDTRDFKLLMPHSGAEVSVPAGGWEVRYSGDAPGGVFTVPAGGKALVMLTRVESADYEGLYASVFENGERRGGARLAILRQHGAPNAGSTAGAQTYEYTPPVETAQPQTVVVTPPAPSVYYTPYGYPYYPYYPYYSSYPNYFYYRPYPLFGTSFRFNFGGGGHHR